jgi:hypothetical protein
MLTGNKFFSKWQFIRYYNLPKLPKMDQKCDLLCAYANQFALEMAVCNFKEKDLIC